jgi:hypothetical protein
VKLAVKVEVGATWGWKKRRPNCPWTTLAAPTKTMATTIRTRETGIDGTV